MEPALPARRRIGYGILDFLGGLPLFATAPWSSVTLRWRDACSRASRPGRSGWTQTAGIDMAQVWSEADIPDLSGVTAPDPRGR